MAADAATFGTRPDFFIIGCQRSGTTLMRLVLECHSQIECADEGIAYRVLAGQHDPVRSRSLLGLKVPAVTEQLADTTLWDPTGIDEMPNPYRGQPLVFLVRDARDTIASMRALHVDGRRWIDGWLLPTVAAKRARCTTFAERFATELAAIDAAGASELALAAFYWRYKTEALFDYRSRGLPAIMVRYEDLVTRPRTELQRVCAFLEVPWEPDLLAHARLAHAEVDDRGFTIGGTPAHRAINDLSVDRWRAVFTGDEASAILQFAGARQAELYPADEPETSGR